MDFTEKMSDFGGRVRQVCQSCIWPVRKIILKKNNFSIGLSFSYFFGTEREKCFDQAQPCLFTVDKTEFPNSGAQFWDFFPTFFCSLIFFGILVWIVSIFSWKFQEELSKRHFTCTGEHFMKNWISAERCNISFHNFVLYGKMGRIFGAKVRQVCQSCSLPVRKIISKKNNFSRELSFSYIFET